MNNELASFLRTKRRAQMASLSKFSCSTPRV
jgi:hypothetical protein